MLHVIGVLGALAVVVEAGAMPPDNSRAPFRDNVAYFAKQWPDSKLLSGVASHKGQLTDMALHSFGNSTSTGIWAAVDMLYPFSWEKEFVGSEVTAFCRKWWWVSYAAASAYLIALWMGSSHMEHVEPYDLRRPLAAWNLLLAVFSFVGAVRTVPHLFLMLGSQGFQYTLCRSSMVGYLNGPSGFWLALFIFSKYGELLDTAFLVWHKKSVGFLHWYHHCSVLLYCWHAYYWEMPTGIYFCAMNYTVHAIMYFYYFLAAVCQKPPKWAMMVTILQLSQMACGVAITLSHINILLNDKVAHCDGHIPNLTAALAMYASYFILFAQFLFKRFFSPKGKGAKKVA